MLDHVIIIAFSVLLLSGAYFGFKAGSKISLIMGIVSGILIGLGDGIIRYNVSAGFLYLMVISGLLEVTFVQRFLKTKKMMPAGMLMIVSGLFFAFSLYRFFNL